MLLLGKGRTSVRYAKTCKFRAAAYLYGAHPEQGIHSPPGWSGRRIEIANQDFDFANAVKAELERQESTWPANNLFSLSPLTTPESTPPSSPKMMTYDSPLSPALTPISDLRHNSAHGPDMSLASSHCPTTEPLEIPALPLPLPAIGDQTFTAAHPVERKRRKTTRSNLTRKKKRLHAKEENFGLATPRPEAYDKHLSAAQPLQTNLKAVDIRATKTGYTGLNHKVQEQSAIALEDLIGPDSVWKFKLQKWDGK